MDRTPRLSIVSPLYVGEGTGASVYYQLLVRALRKRGWRVQVISEFTSLPVTDVDDYVGLLPLRASSSRRWARDAWAYARQNVAYFDLEKHVARFGADVALVHSSFANLPGVFPLALSRLSSRVPTILDVRDVLFGRNISRVAARAEHVISCAENVTTSLIAAGVPAHRISTVPVPQEPLGVPHDGVAQVRTRFALTQPYLLYAGMIKEAKGVDTLIRAYRDVVRPRRPQYELVLAGREKWAWPGGRRLQRQAGVRSVGAVPRASVLMLMAGAELVVNPSQAESIGRSSLEALAVGRPVILPAKVPEFAREAPQSVACADAAGLGRQILAHLDAPNRVAYDLRRHEVDRIVDRYEVLFADARRRPA